MRRILLVLAVAALMAMMLVVMAAPAMARGTGSGGVVKIIPLSDVLRISPKSSFLTDNPPNTSQDRTFTADPKYPVDPVYPTDPVNPNVYPSDPV